MISDDRRKQELMMALAMGGAGMVGAPNLAQGLAQGVGTGLQAYQQGMTRARKEASQQQTLDMQKQQLAQALQISKMNEAGRNTRQQASMDQQANLMRLKVSLQEMLRDPEMDELEKEKARAEIARVEAYTKYLGRRETGTDLGGIDMSDAPGKDKEFKPSLGQRTSYYVGQLGKYLKDADEVASSVSEKAQKSEMLQKLFKSLSGLGDYTKLP